MCVGYGGVCVCRLWRCVCVCVCICTTLQSVLHISASKCWGIIRVGGPRLQVVPVCDSKVLQHLM